MAGLAHTYTTRTFAGEIVIVNRKKEFKMNSTMFYQNEINKFQVGDRVTMNITNRKPKRTEQQNRYLWGVYYPVIAQETGEQNIDILHELFKGLFLTIEIREVLGKKVRVTKSTTNLSVLDFIEFVMAIENYTGIKAPPTENSQLAPLLHSSDVPIDITDSQLPIE